MRGALVAVALAASSCKPVQLVIQGDHHDLRSGVPRTRPSSPDAPPILVLALDGVSRRLLYDLLRDGKLPNLARLLGGDHLKHAHLDDRFLSTLPSTTMAAWATMFTGLPPAQHGVTGNEYFIRETRTLAVPAPVSFSSIDATMELYTDNYLNSLIDGPTVYERVRQHDPDALIWVAMSPVYRGADLLVMPNAGVLAKGLEGYLSVMIDGHETTSRDVYAALDTNAIDSIVDRLREGPPPDVLTLYLYGADLYAHVAPQGPDRARRDYLRRVIDPALGKLVKRLRKLHRLDRTWVIVTADHGHTEVLSDDDHALARSADVPDLLRAVGFRPRPFSRDIEEEDEAFSAVLAYGGALAYVYLADRSRCPNIHDVCEWQLPPRYEEDVLIAAEAFHRANERGPTLRGTLDMILVREPRPVDDTDLPFEVYVGDGKTMPIDRYIAEHPHPTYVAVAERLRDLAVGRHGERAGDIVLVAHNGDRERREDRYYFASRYHSWHGSPSRADSEIPLIVANHHHRAAEIKAWIDAMNGDRPYAKNLTPIIVGLRGGALGQ